MPGCGVYSTLFDTPVYSANVFENDEACVLQHVSAMTGDLDAVVTISVYLLDEDAESPTDGTLLESVTGTFPYAGYHRLTLPEKLLFPAGSCVGITVLQKVPGDKYALVNTFGNSKEANAPGWTSYSVGVINPGESFVSFEDGRWLDWSAISGGIVQEGNCASLAFDNLPIKGYVYPLDGIRQVHELDSWLPVAGGTAAACRRTARQIGTKKCTFYKEE